MKRGAKLVLGLLGLAVPFTIGGQVSAAPAQTPSRALAVADVLNVTDLQGEPAFHPSDDIVAVTLSRRRDAPMPAAGGEPHFLYSVDQRGVPTSQNASHMLLVNLHDGAERAILPDARSWAPAWSPDGAKLAFLSDEGGQIGLWIWDKASGSASRVDLPAPPMVSALSPSLVWLPDSRHIVVPTRSARSPAYDGRLPSETEREDGIDVFVSPERDHTAAAGNGLSGILRSDITLVDLGGRQAQVLQHDVDAVGLWASPDGRWLAIEKSLGTGSATQHIRSRIYFLNLNTRATVAPPRDLTGGYGPLTAQWSPDGTAFVYLNDGAINVLRPASGPNPIALSTPPGIGAIGSGSLVSSGPDLSALVATNVDGRQVSRLMRVDLDHDTLVGLVSSQQFAFLGMVGETAGREDRQPTILGQDELSQEAVILRGDGRGGVRAVQRGGFAFSSSSARFSALRNGSFFAFLERPDQPMEIWRLSASRDSRARLSRLNEPLHNVAFAIPRLVQVEGQNGRSLRSVLLVPPQWRAGLRCPLIVRPYGDQRPVRRLFHFGVNGSGVENLQLLASRGYAVLIPDLPVTPGAPLTSIRARVGEVVRRVGAMGISDSDRLGVFGHSFGGYASTALLTDEQGGFRSAVVSAPVGLDMLSYYGFMDGNAASPFVAWTEDGQSRANANPWSDPSRLLANSPLLQLDHVQAPVLVIQGSADQPRVPQSNELFVGLRRLGKHAEYRFYAGEPHWPGEWGASDAADYLNRTLEWFATTLGQTERDADRVPPPEAICR